MMAQSKKPFELTGRHVLFIMIGFFGAIIAVNVVFVRYAVESFPGEQVKKSYYQGLKYNEALEEKDRQAEKGWRMLLTTPPIAGEQSLIDVKLVNKDGSPIYSASLEGTLTRPTTDDGTKILSFYPIGEGIYQSKISDLTIGAWDLTLTAGEKGAEDIQLSASTRIRVE